MRLPEDIAAGTQLIGMQAFLLAFGVALIVTVIETLMTGYRLIRAGMQGDYRPVPIQVQ